MFYEKSSAQKETTVRAQGAGLFRLENSTEEQQTFMDGEWDGG